MKTLKEMENYMKKNISQVYNVSPVEEKIDVENLKKLLCASEDEYAKWAEEISDTIFDYHELSDEEFKSSRYLADKMKELGFDVTYPYLGIETAFRCEYGDNDGPKVAFLAEYDALPGFGKNHNESAHACGHNWIAASTAAACAALAKLSDKFHGKVILIGTPGEEFYGRKVNMAKKGAFDDLDAVLQMHLNRENCVDTVALAITDFAFEFYGKAAHASKGPEYGINALDACNLTFAGINALRQQLSPDVKIHSIITNGGQSSNIIPEYASIEICIRAASAERLEKVAKRVLDIGKGAELMTGAKFVYKRAENTYYDIKSNEKLNTLMKQNLSKLGIVNLVKGDIYHCESTDIGNVSYVCPTCYTTLSTSHLSDAGLHEEEFIEIAKSDGAKELLHIAAKAMGMTALDIYENGQKLS